MGRKRLSNDERRQSEAIMVGARYEEDLHRDRGRDGLLVKATRKGLEVSGWFDSCVGIGEPVEIPWEHVDEARRKVDEVRPKGTVNL